MLLTCEFLFLSLIELIQPSPGEVRFFTGIDSSDRRHSPSMIWCYKEPRYITKIHVLPVPFEITSEEDCPTDLKVRELYLNEYNCRL